MMNRKLKGFSLAELLISLLVISIVLSAAIPTLTRKSTSSREYIWRWSQENNSAYFGVGSNQSAIIGADSIPLKRMLGIQGEDTTNKYSLGDIIGDKEINIDGVKFSNFGDKLILLKKSVFMGADGKSEPSDFANSHISFYTASNKEAATTADIKYVGRIAADQHNLAFGIGTLQSMNNITEEYKGENTALGHYTLLRTTSGSKNTAVGEKALSFNTEGAKNTAVGFHSLFRLGVEETETAGQDSDSLNTGVGYGTLEYLKDGKANTAIGSLSMGYATGGQENVALGYASLISAGSTRNNVSIGSNSCSVLQYGDNNICIGYRAGLVKSSGTEKNITDYYGIYIGSSSDEQSGPDLIMGHTQPYSGNIDKELILNAKNFIIRTYNGGAEIFKVRTFANRSIADIGDGYGSGAYGYTGQVLISLRKNFSDSTSLSFTGTQQNVVIGAYNEDASVKDKINAVKNISFNEVLEFQFPKSSSEKLVTISTTSIDAAQTQKYNLSLNGKIEIEDNNDTPTIKLTKDDGFSLSTGSSGKSLKISSNKVELNLFQNNDYLKTDLTSFFELKVNSGKFEISSKESGYIKADGNFYIGKNNVQFSQLASVTIPGQAGGKLSANLSDNFTSLWSVVDQIRRGTAGYSDERLKDISGDNTAGLKEINALEVKNFTYKDDKEKTPHVGVIAQQLQKIFPNAVFADEKGFLSIRTEDMFYAMVNSIKELCSQIQELTAKITGLDKRITELEKQNELLKKQNKEFEKRLLKLEKASK